MPKNKYQAVVYLQGLSTIDSFGLCKNVRKKDKVE